MKPSLRAASPVLAGALVLLTVLGAWLLVACSGFRLIIAPDLGTLDLGPKDFAGLDLGGELDLATTDLAGDPPPPDEACPDPWTNVAPLTGSCKGHWVWPVVAVSSNSFVSITRAPSGRLALMHNLPTGVAFADSNVRVHTFDLPATDPMTAPLLTDFVDLNHGAGSYAGRAGAIAASGGAGTGLAERFELAYSVATSLPEFFVAYRQWPVAGGPVSAFENAGAVGPTRAGGLDLAVTPTGEAWIATYHVDGNNLGHVEVRHRSAGAAWGPLHELENDLNATTQGVGQLSLTLNGLGNPILAWHHGFNATDNWPYVAEYDGAQWGAPNAVDCPGGSNGGTWYAKCGFAPTITELAGIKTILYYYVTPDAKAELKQVSWSSIPSGGFQQVQREKDIPSSLGYPQHRSALAVDRWGQLHYAAIEPDPAVNGDEGRLVYVRQRIVVGSSGLVTEWLKDVVDPLVFISTAASFVWVDLFVDYIGRPHIAYYNAVSETVNYATRLDRE